jgi:hypothetical protein
VLNDFPLKISRKVGERFSVLKITSNESLNSSYFTSPSSFNIHGWKTFSSLFFGFSHSLLNPGVSGLRFGLKILSRSPSSLVCPSIDSSFVGGDNDAQAGLDESVRNESLPVPVPPLPVDELLPDPNNRPLNLENFYQSSQELKPEFS